MTGFTLSDSERRLTQADIANQTNPTPQTANALDQALTRDIEINQGQQNVSNALTNFSRGVVDTVSNVGGFLTAGPGGGGLLDVVTGNNVSGGGVPGFAGDFSNQIDRRGQQVANVLDQFAPGSPDFDPNAELTNYLSGTRNGQFRTLFARPDTAPGALGNINPKTNVPYDIEAGRQVAAINQGRQGEQGQPGAGIVIPETGQQNPLEQQRLRLIRELDSAKPQDFNRVWRQIRALDRVADDQITEGRNFDFNQQQREELAARLPGQRTERLARLAQTLQAIENSSPQSRARDAATAAAQTVYEQTGDGNAANEVLLRAGQRPIYPAAEGFMMGGLVEGYADGGYIDPSRQMASGTGAIGSMGAQGGDMMAMQRYTEYATKAREMNLPLMGFAEFQKMANPQGGAQVQRFAMGGMVEGYAEGGSVDASGAMVVDPDPNAPTDSIPAVIDGQRPAALDSGEFVMPKAAVMFYGTDKLNKMVEKAMGGGAKNGGEQSAIAQFGGAGAG